MRLSSSSRPCRGTPEQRRLAVQVSRQSLPVEVILPVVFLVRPLADFPDICVFIDVANESEPRFSCGRRIRFFVEPTFLYARDECEGEHARARRLRPRCRIVDQLAPHTGLFLGSDRRSSLMPAAIQPSPRPQKNGTSGAW